MLNFGKIDVNELHKYIQKIAGKEISSAGLNPVLTGVIIESLIGYYVVQLSEGDSSSSIKATVMDSKDSYIVGDSVYIIQGNSALDINYFIFGKVKDIQEEYINLSLVEKYQAEESATIGEWVNDIFLYPSGDAFNIVLKENGILQLKGDFTYNSNLYIRICNERDEIIDTLFFTKYDYQGLVAVQQDDSIYLPQEKIFLIDKNILPNISYICLEAESKDTRPKNISISAGSLLAEESQLKVDLNFTNGLNYFSSKANFDEQVRITANVYYNEKKLESDKINYYWFIKDNNFLSTSGDSEDYMPLGGYGFRCLNTYQEVDAIDLPEGQKLRIWDKKNNYFLLSKNIKEKDYFKDNFISKIKCIAVYEDIIIESNLVDVYNYTEQKFEAVLIPSVSPSNIISTEDSITLTCEISNTNKDVDLKDYQYTYIWSYSTDDKNSWTILSNESDIKWVDSKLIIKDNFIDQKEGSSNPEDLSFEMVSKKCYFSCKVKIKHRLNNDNTIEEVDSNSECVISYAEEAAALEQKERFKYCISSSHGEAFVKEQGTGDSWNGDWKSASGINWLEVSTNISNPIDFIFNDIATMFNGKDSSKDYYVYYTKQIYWEKQKLDKVEIIRAENWEYPLIARMVGPVQGELKNLKIGASIDQLNTFNQLTQGGKTEGIFYKDLGRISSDSKPIVGKKYYILNSNTMEYDLITCTVVEWGFKRGMDYYSYDPDSSTYKLEVEYNKDLTYYRKDIVQNENGTTTENYSVLEKNEQNFDIVALAWPSNITKTTVIYENVENSLFINASYINTGTLRVGDSEAEKFYASLDDDDIRIGGFNITDSTLQGKNLSVGFNSNGNKLENLAIWAGQQKQINETKKHPFEVNHNGDLYAQNADITGKITATELYIGAAGTATAFNNILEDNLDTAKDYADQKDASLSSSVTTQINSLQSQYQKSTFFTVNTTNNWICLKAKSPTEGQPGVIFFDTDQLIINSPNLKFNTTETGAGNLVINGTIYAANGIVGGFHITSNHLADGELNLNGSTDDHLVMLSPGDDNGFVFWAGSQQETGKDESRPFWIKNNGSIRASVGTIANMILTDQGFYSGYNETDLKTLFKYENAVDYEKGFYLGSEGFDIGKLLHFTVNGKHSSGTSFGRLQLPNIEKLDDGTIVSIGGIEMTCTMLGSFYQPPEDSWNGRHHVKISTGPGSAPGIEIAANKPNSTSVYSSDYNAEIRMETYDWSYMGSPIPQYALSIFSDFCTCIGYSEDAFSIPDAKSSNYLRFDANGIRAYGTGYVSTGVVVTSDRNEKKSIQLQPTQYSLVFDNLKPVIFKYNNGTSDRYHTGLIAQDVEEAVIESGLSTKDFAAICYQIDSETNEKKEYGIRYEELVSMCIYEIQKNKARIKELEDRLKEIKGE